MAERQTEIYAAGLVMPVASPPIRDGAVLVRDGRIEAVGELSEIGQQGPGTEVRFFPGATILPGAVNAHAHLGFRRGDAPEGGNFARWLTELLQRFEEKKAWTPEAARDSAREAVQAGTTYMAESSPYGECLPQLAGSGMAGAVFAEFFPVEFDSPEESADFISEKVAELRRGLPERVEAQASVHAPYTIHPTAARLVARRARESGDPLAIHLAESHEEVEFFRDGTGLLTELGGAEWAGQGISPVAYAEKIELLGPRTIAAHVSTGVSDEDLDILARTDTAVVHCPRSNRNLGCGTARVPGMLERGIRVGMGTDGLWSSDDMNLWAETLAAADLHGFGGELALELATIRGALALGLEAEIGSLEAGKRADLAIVEAAPGERADPGREVLEAAASGGVSATVVSGRLIYNRIEQ